MIQKNIPHKLLQVTEFQHKLFCYLWEFIEVILFLISMTNLPGTTLADSPRNLHTLNKGPWSNAIEEPL